jgi:RNA polymerase sigma-70 factor (ECF subfamily)
LEAFDEQLFSEPDIETVIQSAIESLPEKCREIFILSKIEGKKQKAIAQELNISVNTVENQMAIAYKKLKEILKDYLPLLIFLFV